MGIPQVVIVGRPNVGKSSVFNWLAGQRIAIVDNQPGVTRDRMTQLVSEHERFFELVDTGGMGIDDVDDLTEHIEQQISVAIESAHVILFVVDTLTGLVPLDVEVAKRLRYVAKRMIVGEVPGTTRDSVDVKYDLDGKRFIAIDTPGLRRHKSVKTDLDFYGTHRAKRSIRRADVVLLFFDAAERISKVDKQLCEYIASEYKPCVFVVNKWDQYAGSVPTEKWVHYLRDTFRTMPYVPIAFITGQSGKNVKALLNHGQMLFKQTRQRTTTGELNRVIRAALDYNPPPMIHHRRPKVFYATQVGIQPPTIVLFCNQPGWFTEPYRRFLLGWLRDHLEFAEVPIKLYLRQRGKSDTQDDIDTHMTARRDARDPRSAENAKSPG